MTSRVVPMVDFAIWSRMSLGASVQAAARGDRNRANEYRAESVMYLLMYLFPRETRGAAR
jgi:hypothetical protein